MPDDDVADAEFFDDDEEEEWEDDEEEDLLFGKIPRTPGLVAIAAILLVIIILLAALFSTEFGIRGGISNITVSINNTEGELDDKELDVEALTGTPAFGSNADGDGDLTITWDGEEVYSTSIKIIDGRGYKSIPYEDFYVDNGEYTATVDFEGKSDSDTILLRRTAHEVISAQRDIMWTEPGSSDEDEKVILKITLFPDEDNTGDHDVLFIPGEGDIDFYFVPNENDQGDRSMHEYVTSIEFTSDFDSFEYNFKGDTPQERSDDQGYIMDFYSHKLTSDKDEGYYTFTVYFNNTYGIESLGAFRDTISDDTPEENPNDSFTWLHLGDDDAP